MQKREGGITLIALVITIIILLILAGVSISVLTESGLFERTKEAEQKYDNAQVKENETLLGYESIIDEYLNRTNNCPIKFGSPYSISFSAEFKLTYIFYEDGSLEFYFNEVSDGSDSAGTVSYKSTKIIDLSTGEVIGVVSDDGTKIDMGEDMILVLDSAFLCAHLKTEIQNATDSYSGDTVCTTCGTILTTGFNIIPDGGVYYVGVTSVDVGDYTGATAIYNSGDKFPEIASTGDVYVYEDYEYRYNQRFVNTSVWSADTKGWGVRVLDTTKTSYSEILEYINDKPVEHLISTFMDCTLLTIAPTIPSQTTSIAGMFSNCIALKTYVGNKDGEGDFSNYIIPTGVQNMMGTFRNCELLVKAPSLPSRVGGMIQTFYGCTSLIVAPEIPKNVSSLHFTFYGCTSLKTVPIIPNTIESMVGTFGNCTSLTGTITINANPSDWTLCLYNTGVTEILGETTMATNFLATVSSTEENP